MENSLNGNKDAPRFSGWKQKRTQLAWRYSTSPTVRPATDSYFHRDVPPPKWPILCRVGR